MGDSERARYDLRPQDGIRYRVELLLWAQVGDDGVAHGEGAIRQTLAWSRVLHALAAEVGEPEGVRTIVFDLVVERKADECLVYRFDVEPGSDAQAVAARIVERVGTRRSTRSLLDLAADGDPVSA